MVDQGLKIVMAMGVLLGGLGGALLFRAPPRSGPFRPAPPTPLVLRDRDAPVPKAEFPLDGPQVRIESSRPTTRPAETPERPPTVLAPLDPGAPPPIMAKSYPRSPQTATTRWGTSMALGVSNGSETDEPARTHRIVDGDTLEALAERYLGSASRFTEIYEANRHLLPGPAVLPIGIELKIPPRSEARSRGTNPTAHGPLVPIPPNALRRPRSNTLRTRSIP